MLNLFAICLLSIAYCYFLYPALLAGLSLFADRRRPPGAPDELPSVSHLIIVRNAGKLIEAKMENLAELDYPPDKLETIIVDDGSADGTADVALRCLCGNLNVISNRAHAGKSAAINAAILQCGASIIVFSDADSLLDPQAIRNLVRWFADPEIGGVTGRRVVAKGADSIADPQARYFRYDNFIRRRESDVASAVGNEGKLSAIRAELFVTIPEFSVDDLHIGLSVVEQGRRLIFDPDAVAKVPPSVKESRGEIARRRRIVVQSFATLWARRGLFIPWRYGLFSLCLFSHKVFRRLAPVFLAGLFAASWTLSARYPPFFWLSLAQCGFYFLPAALVESGFLRAAAFKPLRKPIATAYYFTLGNVGTFLGILDFILGKRVSKWSATRQ
jgi:biofilm PGA synthesis N-glycosyltransferase PgaC